MFSEKNVDVLAKKLNESYLHREFVIKAYKVQLVDELKLLDHSIRFHLAEMPENRSAEIAIGD